MISPDDIISVYTGRDGECCCGCAGDHIYHSTKQTEGSEHRGYAVGDDEVDDKKFQWIIDVINQALKTEDLGSCISTVVGDRIFIAYRRRESAEIVKAKREAALAKLTTEERELLGV